jgi:hypothetical protein
MSSTMTYEKSYDCSRPTSNKRKLGMRALLSRSSHGLIDQVYRGVNPESPHNHASISSNCRRPNLYLGPCRHSTAPASSAAKNWGREHAGDAVSAGTSSFGEPITTKKHLPNAQNHPNRRDILNSRALLASSCAPLTTPRALRHNLNNL